MRPQGLASGFQIKGFKHGQSGHHQGQARLLGGHRLLLCRQEELAHHDRQAGQEEVRPGRAQARRVPRVQDQVNTGDLIDELNGALAAPLSFERARYAIATSGGCVGLMNAKATWIIPPASPSATRMRQAIVQEPSESYSRPPPYAPRKLPSCWLMNASPWIIACH